jgi:HEAT repeat protein
LSVRSHKTAARAILLKRDRARLENWARSATNPLRVLSSLTYEENELLRWRAVEAAGWVASSLAETGLDKLRDAVRRLLWLMNDESGGVGWHAPELIGEILCNVPVLIPEFAELLPSFLREEPFKAGTHFALDRIASIAPASVAGCADLLAPSLNDPDPMIRALAARVLVFVSPANISFELNRLRTDVQEFRIYDFNRGELIETSVGQVLEDILASVPQ